MQYIAEYGLKTSIYCCFTLIGLLQIPSKALREALPQNQLDKSKLILVDQQKVCLDQLDVCDIDDLGFRYLLEVLTDPDIPYTEKEQKVGKRLAKFFGFKRPNQLNVRIIICFIFLLYLLYFQNKSAFYIMMKHLIKAIQEGRISKRIARLIARRLKAKGVPIDPELLEIISSDND